MKSIKVKAKHIKNGLTEAHSCPIALAIEEALPDATEISVTEENVNFEYNGCSFCLNSNKQIVDFIQANDNFKDRENDGSKEYKKVKTLFEKICRPFEFIIDPFASKPDHEIQILKSK